MTDAVMFHDSHFTDLSIPNGKYFFADTGFPTCSTLLMPYCGPQYHLAEWGHAKLQYILLFYYFLLFNIVAHDIILLSGVVHSYSMYYYYTIFYYFLLIVFSPAKCEELFNLRHAKAQNVIERSFGVIKRWFKILIIPPEYSRDVQADDNINIIEDFGQLATEYQR